MLDGSSGDATMPSVSVLGIDPGSRRCGYGLVRRAAAGLARLDSGVFLPGELPLAERLACIFDGLSELLARGGVEAVAIETAYCGRSPRSALVLGQARGVALAAAARAGLPVFEYAPSEVKRAFTGNGRAEKTQMVRTARSLFGLSPRLSDEADALAVAVCHLAHGAGRAGAAVSGASARRRAAQRGVLRSSVRRFDGAP
jgi:crossover junction endodeoxyribonuclease RuvC